MQGENRPGGQAGQPASGRVDLYYLGLTQEKGPWKIPECGSIFGELLPFFPPPLKIEDNLIIFIIQ
jgi:hypothetical protein